MVRLSPRRNSQFPSELSWPEASYIWPNIIPRTTPIISATQSFISVLRLKVGCISSMRLPNALAHKYRDQSNAASSGEGKESTAKAMICTTLSLPSGAAGGVSKGQSIATVRVTVTMRVMGISRYFRIS